MKRAHKKQPPRGSRKQRQSKSRPAEKSSSVPRKHCTGCGKMKPLTEFYTNNAARDGKQSRCSECVKAYDKAYRSDEMRRAEKKQYLRSYYAQRRKESGKPYRRLVEVHPDEALLSVTREGRIIMLHKPASGWCDERSFQKVV